MAVLCDFKGNPYKPMIRFIAHLWAKLAYISREETRAATEDLNATPSANPPTQPTIAPASEAATEEVCKEKDSLAG